MISNLASSHMQKKKKRAKIKHNVKKEKPGLFLVFIMLKHFWKPQWGDVWGLFGESVAAPCHGDSQQCVQAPLTNECDLGDLGRVSGRAPQPGRRSSPSSPPSLRLSAHCCPLAIGGWPRNSCAEPRCAEELWTWMQVSGLVVTPTWGSTTEEELRPLPPHFPGGGDQVSGCLSL